MKGLQWEVTLRHSPELYYKGRGGTSEQALMDLKQSLQQGIQSITNELESLQRKHEKLNDAIGVVEGGS